MPYIYTKESRLYLAVVVDLFSRRVVGRAISSTFQASSVNGSPAPSLRPEQKRGRRRFEWIGVWYNHKRRHSTIGYISPEEFEYQQQRLEMTRRIA